MKRLPFRKLLLDGDAVSVEVVKWLGRFNMCKPRNMGTGGGYKISGDYRGNRIRIVDTLPPFYERDTILHEGLHKVWEKSGLGDRFSARTEEFIIGQLSPWLLRLLQENPEFVSYLQEDK